VKVKIYSCHHERPIFPASGELFMPIWTGGEADPAGRWLTDVEGLNLHAARDFNEMRQEFFAWRNLLDGVDYIGFEHYRRLFLLDPLTADDCAARFPRVLEARRSMAANSLLWRYDSDTETFVQYVQLRNSLAPAEIGALTDWIASHDIIVPRRHTFAPLDIQWQQCDLSDELWAHFIEAIAASKLFQTTTNYMNFSQIGVHFCNMFIMKVDLFREYMQFWSDVMFSVQGMVDRSSRHLGYLSERLFSLWVLQKQIENPLLRVTDLPYLFCPELDLADALAGISTSDGKPE
jgi:hypothetical protein